MGGSLLTDQDRTMLQDQLAMEALHAGAAVDAHVDPFDSGYAEFTEDSVPSYLRLTQHEERIIRNEGGHSPTPDQQRWLDPDADGDHEPQAPSERSRAASMSFNSVEVDSNGALRVAPPQELAERKSSSHRFGGSATELSEMHEVCEPHMQRT